MIGKSLPKAVGYGHDLVARESMLLASCMAGMAFSSAGLGLCHAMAHQPGGAAYSARSGERHVAANGDGVQPDGLS